jgi:hypothetical protein
VRESLHILAGSAPERLRNQPPLPPFSEQALVFLKSLSAELLGQSDPGLVALGFWLRPAALQQLRKTFAAAPAGYQRTAAGVALHLTPGNVDNLFAYAWVISLLCGNADIIRLSSKPSAERDRLVALIRRLFDAPANAVIAARTAIVSYGHDDAVTTWLSALADRRVIWGGDDTVAHLRALPAPPPCQDIVFPDRQSAALLSAQAVAASDDLDSLIETFYRDAYGFNQMACSSPRLLVWLGEDDDIAAARTRFWPALAENIARRNPPLSEAELMDKLVAIQSMALTADLTVLPTSDQRLHVARLSTPDTTVMAEHCGGGLFFEAVAADANDVARWLPSRTQTLSHWGLPPERLAELHECLAGSLPDRLVPIGQALNFDPVWDGMDLFERLSRTARIVE